MRVGPHRLDVALVGGGHAHVEVLRRAAMEPAPGVRLTVVARDAATPYSGMLPGYVAELYTRDEAHIDLRPLCARAGARLVHAPATGLDLDARRVLFDDRPPLRFDIAAIDIGSTPATAGVEGSEIGLPVKPVDRFLERWREFEDEAVERDGPWCFAVAGGGAGGVELCLGLRRRLARRIAEKGGDASGLRACLVAEALLPGHGRGARRRLTRALEADGVALRLGRRVAALRPGCVVCDDGAEIRSDATVLATGAAAPAWLGGKRASVSTRTVSSRSTAICGPCRIPSSSPPATRPATPGSGWPGTASTRCARGRCWRATCARSPPAGPWSLSGPSASPWR